MNFLDGQLGPLIQRIQMVETNLNAFEKNFTPFAKFQNLEYDLRMIVDTLQGVYEIESDFVG